MQLLLLHGNHLDIQLWALPKISCGFSTYLLNNEFSSGQRKLQSVYNLEAQSVIGDEWLNFSVFIYS